MRANIVDALVAVILAIVVAGCATERMPFTRTVPTVVATPCPAASLSEVNDPNVENGYTCVAVHATVGRTREIAPQRWVIEMTDGRDSVLAVWASDAGGLREGVHVRGRGVIVMLQGQVALVLLDWTPADAPKSQPKRGGGA